MSDGSEDDDRAAVSAYRAKRMAEMREQAGSPRPGMPASDQAGGSVDDEPDQASVRDRAKRMAEMREQAGCPRFGELLHLPASDYAREINQAGADVWVVLALVAPGESCDRLHAALSAAARRNPFIKFASMRAAACIPGYPEANCPTLLVYNSDQLRAQLIGPRSVGLPPDAPGAASVGAGAGERSAATDERAVGAALAKVVRELLLPHASHDRP